MNINASESDRMSNDTDSLYGVESNRGDNEAADGHGPDGDLAAGPSESALASAPGFARHSFAHTGVKQDGFQSAALNARGNDKIVEVYKDVKQSLFSLDGLFIACGLITYVSMVIFASISMKTFEDCTVYEPEQGRCCSCEKFLPLHLVDQTLPKTKAYNNIVYSALIILNATFAFFYCVIAIRRENKYQIVCSLVAQFTSVVRAGADVFLETRHFAKDQQPIRIASVGISLLFVIVSALITPKLFNKFGWVIFKRSAGNPKQRTAYTLYQLYRSFNWLEIQSAVVLLAAIFGYLGMVGAFEWFPFACVCVLEVISARQAIHHLKRDNLRLGVGLSLFSKVFVLVYCVCIVVQYFQCRSQFFASLIRSAHFLDMNPLPLLKTVSETYDGLNCLGEGIVHDDRATESFVLNLVLLVIWRFSAVANLLRIFQTTEGGGLKSLFYKKKRDKSEAGYSRKRYFPDGTTIPNFNQIGNESSLIKNTEAPSAGPNLSSEGSSGGEENFVPSGLTDGGANGAGGRGRAKNVSGRSNYSTRTKRANTVSQQPTAAAAATAAPNNNNSSRIPSANAAGNKNDNLNYQQHKSSSSSDDEQELGW